MRINVIAFSSNGCATALRLGEVLRDENIRLFCKTSSETHGLEPVSGKVGDWVGASFEECDAIVFIGATGIAVRYIAPFIRGKDVDPAVVCMDELGRWAIALLSGHIGGCNELAVRIADGMGAEAIVTTATDLNGRFSVDTFAARNDLRISSLKIAKDVSARVLDGRFVGFRTEIPIEGDVPDGITIADEGEFGVCVSRDPSFRPFGTTLSLTPMDIVLGVGCKRGTDPERMHDFISETLEGLAVAPERVGVVASIDLKKDEDGKIIYSDDFFGKMTSLTVSGQLEGELGATALGQIYTFGPTFRAENSNTPRHLAEFWMIEPEVAFIDKDDLMDLEEEFIKYCVQWALDNCKDDLEFLNKMIDKGLIARLEGVLKDSFVRLTYTDGIRILEEAVSNGKKFEFPVSWGMDLASEHERYLVEEHFKKPVIMNDYPKEIKAFYMKMNEDGRTVQGTDVLFPQIGEIIGGSVREESYDKLMAQITERNIPMKDMWWYLDTRKYGTCPHGGFGLGFERLILFVTGMQNIRDVIPFPRTPKTAEF